MVAETWEEWEIEEADNITKTKELQREGHTLHCACRQVWGDGICTCTPGDWIRQGMRSDKILGFMRKEGG